MFNPLVSVIVPTKNSSSTLEACLRSVQAQTYKNIEVILVDNFSTDTTQEIAKKYTDKVFSQGPERSAQRNYAVAQASGEYIVFIDSDMELAPEVITDCVQKMGKTEAVGLVIPEESFGQGFWAECKKLERSFYVGIAWMEAARFFRRETFNQVQGYDEDMVSGEDWDLSQRIGKLGKIDRVSSFIFHNEGRINLWKTMKKKYYYAKKFRSYVNNNADTENLKKQTSLIARYSLFFSDPVKLLKRPFVGFGMLFMKTMELFAGAVAFFGIIKRYKNI